MRQPLRTALILSALFIPFATASASGGRFAASSQPAEVVRLSCTAAVHGGQVSCAPLASDRSYGSALVLDGQNGRYVSSSRIWAADLTIQNPTRLVFGAAAGNVAEPAGIQAHVLGAPQTVAGTGTVSVLNADASTAEQVVFEYDVALYPGQASAARRWQFSVPATVEVFTFQVSVVATVTYPMPWMTLSMPAPRGFAGTTQAPTGTARNRFGAAVPGALRTWSTSDAAVATVDASGAVTSVGPGTATITALVGGLPAASSVVSVCPNLGVGEVYHFDMPLGANFCLGGAPGATAEYTVIPTNQSTTNSVTLSFTATGIVGGTSQQPLAATADPQPISGSEASAMRLGEDLAALDAAEASHMGERLRDYEAVAPLLGTQTSRIQRTSGQPVPALGDTLSFNVAAGCNGTRDVRKAVVGAVTNHTIAVRDVTNPYGENFNNNYTVDSYRLDTLAARVERIAWPAITSAFGEPTDLDGNGRVILFFTRAVNELSPAASQPVSLGYFTNRDLFSTAGCNLSNEAEILYLMVPDPTGAVNNNVRTESSVMGGATRIAGHELQHLINASRRMYVTGTTTFEEQWLDEGLSAIAEELMFYHTSWGLAPRGNINLSNLTSGSFASRRVAAFNTYQNFNYSRLRSYLQRPDTTGVYKNSGTFTTAGLQALGRTGAAWSFLRYAADRRAGNDNTFWAALGGNATATGQANLQNVLGLTAEELKVWYRDWMVSLYVDDVAVIPGVAAKYQTTSWNLRSVFGGLGAWPLLARQLTNATPLTLAFSHSGSSSFLRLGVGAGGFATFTTTSGGVPPGSNVGITVVRTK